MTATIEALDQLAERRLDLLTFLQTLTLEIAGRSMFSVETKRHGPEMRRLLTEFGEKLARPHLFDMLLPAAIPTSATGGAPRSANAGCT